MLNFKHCASLSEPAAFLLTWVALGLGLLLRPSPCSLIQIQMHKRNAFVRWLVPTPRGPTLMLSTGHGIAHNGFETPPLSNVRLGNCASYVEAMIRVKNIYNLVPSYCQMPRFSLRVLFLEFQEEPSFPTCCKVVRRCFFILAIIVLPSYFSRYDGAMSRKSMAVGQVEHPTQRDLS